MSITSKQFNNSNHAGIPNSPFILIVDDERDILSVVRRLLQEHGFNTCCFTRPNAALEHYKLSSNDHNLVISDLQMPKMNGFEFTRKVKEIDSNAKVFLMTSNFEISDRLLLSLAANSVSMNSMIDEFILKPFSIEQLIMLIRKHMESTIRGY